MIANKKKFGTGILLMVAFCVVLVAMFMPFFDGKNGLEYLDDLYNSISKGSAYYIPKASDDAENSNGQQISVTLAMKTPNRPIRPPRLFNAAGALVNVGDDLEGQRRLGQILFTSLDDAKLMYDNNGEQSVPNTATTSAGCFTTGGGQCQAMVADLNKQEAVQGSQGGQTVNTKAIETAYNYYGIHAQNISERWESSSSRWSSMSSTPSGTGLASCTCSKAGACAWSTRTNGPAGLPGRPGSKLQG
jgi:hypothetical protein